MFNWLKGIFSAWDRQQRAAERAAGAAEEVADIWEKVRDEFRARLGIEPPAPVQVTPLPPAKDEEPGQAPASGNGRRAGARR